jgi:hypothetical protein
VRHLRRNLCGLKHAPRIWYETLWADLIGKGSEFSKSCPCVFTMKGKTLYLLIYVDDIFVIGPDEEIAQAKKSCSGPVSYIQKYGREPVSYYIQRRDTLVRWTCTDCVGLVS